MSVEVMLSKAKELWDDGELAEAVAIFKELFVNNSLTVDQLIDLALITLELKDYKSSLKVIDRIDEIKPGFSTTFYLYGITYEEMGKTYEAIENYCYCLDIDPYYIEAHFYLACLLDDSENYKQAITQYKKLLALEPDHLWANINLGHLLEKTNQDKDALRFFLKVYQMDPTNSKNLFNLGVVYGKLGDYLKATEFYYLCLKTDDPYEYTYLNLALIYKEQLNDYEAAYTTYTMGLGQTDMSVLYYNRACVLALMKRTKEAIDDLRNAFNISPALAEYAAIDEELEEVIRYFDKKELKKYSLKANERNLNLIKYINHK